MVIFNPSKNKFYIKIQDRILFSSERLWEGTGEVEIKEHHGHYLIKSVLKEKKKFEGTLRVVSEDPLEIEINGNKTSNRIIMEIELEDDEIIFGGGEQYNELNLRGKKFPLLVQEQGVGRGKNLISLLAALKGVRGDWYTTYFPQPVFFSNKGYGIVLKVFTPVMIELKDVATFEIWNNKCSVIFLEGSIEDMVRKFYEIFGGIFEYEDWMFGVWLASQGGIEKAEKVIETAKKWDIPLHAIWCQDWSGKVYTKFGRQVYWNWEYDREDYHDLPEYISKWREMGIHFLAYINPFLIKDGKMYKEAAKNGYLVKKRDGSVYDIIVTTFPAGLLDLSNPEAFEWYKSVIVRNMISIGIDGWMADFGEYLPLDALLKTSSAVEFHNKYPVEWARLNFEAVKESSRSIIYFMRSGFLGSTKFCPCFWAGDQNVDWSKSDGLPTVVPAMLSSGLSGVRFMHFDIGGYTSLFWLKRTPELFMRWAEVGAFSPVMRTHQTNRPLKNIQFDTQDDILKHFSKMANVHVSLIQYIKEQFNTSLKNNLPVVKPLFLNYPEDLESWRTKYQYLFGDDILVAPVLKHGKRWWRVFLPRGEKWVHIWSQKTFKGGWVEIPAPLGEPPVFIREDSKFSEDILTTIRKIERFYG
ncbi:alpha-glucosidase [Thermotoga sp. KOL6]|uniref:alpha-glucosidase n=1 Tax=Thermotoga sp. KOL6 TaxID=126741 RepID=UPI000C76F825|nr:alpha-glucosidase [Thermotoga sp. KOL6]PLV59156.1 alpha-glucosidase [Thermotoga sp. KOL6]